MRNWPTVVNLVKRSFSVSSRVARFVRPLILGIETSCDDTGAALVDRTGAVLGEALNSQQNIHLRYGGIIPPVAQNLHREHIESVVANTFANAKLSIDDVDAIAVTNRPGLQLSLAVGLRYAKHLARQHSKPLIPIHHMEAHALTARMGSSVEYPFLCLLVSGGHSLLTFVKNVDEFLLLGKTLDDAPGEAFDKIARRMRLRALPEFEWVSGGAAIEMAGKNATNIDRYEFPLPLARNRDCQFSFAGLKNNAIRAIRKDELEFGLGPHEVIPNYSDFCAGFLRAVTRHICHRTQRAIEYCELQGFFRDAQRKTLVFGGGVACNDFIHTAIGQMASQFGFETVRPPKKYCTDNGVMIAWNGVERFSTDIHNGMSDLDSVDVIGKCPLGRSIIQDVKNAELNCKWAKIPIMRGEKPS